jgi:type I restriction-modification system DNA methylase subunit
MRSALALRSGLAGFVLANGSMSSNQSGEGEIRRNIIEADSPSTAAGRIEETWGAPGAQT